MDNIINPAGSFSYLDIASMQYPSAKNEKISPEKQFAAVFIKSMMKQMYQVDGEENAWGGDGTSLPYSQIAMDTAIEQIAESGLFGFEDMIKGNKQNGKDNQ